ncbi:MAG: peptide/nickel transport system permease protein [Solirubrobacteraceae bacterium]
MRSYLFADRAVATGAGAGPEALADEAVPPAGVARSPRASALRRFRRHRLGLLGAAVLVFLAVACAIGNSILGLDPNAVDIGAFRQPPSSAHWLGTDDTGRDVLARVLEGGRISLTIGIAAAVSATTIGFVVGVLAGYRGGLADGVAMRVVDAFLSFPTLVVILVLTAFLGPSVSTIIFVIALCQWPYACRIVRTTAASLRERDYVRASRALGGSALWITLRHIAPGVLGPLTVVVTLLAADAILAEAALSFLGLGVSPPQASWGGMLTDAQSLVVIKNQPWLWLPAGIAIAATVLSINFVGDALRDAFDTRLS